MLSAGFEPAECPYLFGMIRSLVKQKLQDMSKKHKIECPDSRRIMIVSDKTGTFRSGEHQPCLDLTILSGTLAPDECFADIGGTTGVLDQYSQPDGIVIIRTPAYDSRAVLRLKVVKNQKLVCTYQGPIIVLSEQGLRSKSDEMNGDFDGDFARLHFVCCVVVSDSSTGSCNVLGDEPWCCWHAPLVKWIPVIDPMPVRAKTSRHILVPKDPAARLVAMRDCFFDVIAADTLGSLATTLTAVADIHGSNAPEVTNVPVHCGRSRCECRCISLQHVAWLRVTSPMTLNSSRPD